MLLLLAISAGWAAFFAHRGWLVAAAGALLIVAGYLVVMAIEFLLLRRSAEPSRRPSAWELTSAWCKEVVIAPQVFLWRQPFRSAAIPDHPNPTGEAHRAVVFVHGLVCNRGFWNPWMKLLHHARVPFVAISLEPVFGSIDAYAAAIREAIAGAHAATGHAPVVVAHSMGGLAVRACLARRDEDLPFHRIVTIGTPHHGAALARHSHTTNTRQMRIGSPWLRDLERVEAADAHERYTCFWSRCDNIVFPAATAMLAHADNRELDATPHVAMAYHPAVIAEVLRLVQS